MRARTTLRLICVICLIVLFAPTSTAISARTKPDNYSPVLFLGTKSPLPMCSSSFDPTFQTLTNDPDVSRFAGDASVAECVSTDVFKGIFFNAFKIDSQATPAVIKDGLLGPQGCGHCQFQSQRWDTAALGRDYASATTGTQDLGQISIPADPGAANARIQLTPFQSPVFLVNPSAVTAGRGSGIIRIGRLELERKDNHDPESDGPVRVDPSDMFRAALHLLPKPAISLAFNLHWAKR